MEINGKQIADDLLQTLQKKVETLKKEHIVPTMAVILVGDDPGSASYVRQKEKAAERIGATLRATCYEGSVTKEEIQSTMQQLNNDPGVHGIIIQRPLPKHLQDPTLLNSILPTKDIDGFVPGSKFQVPVAIAVERILDVICHAGPDPASLRFRLGGRNDNFYRWLSRQNIVIIGRGETAGGPIAKQFQMSNVKCQMIHSQTREEEKKRLLINADIIMSCVGKERVIKKENIKKGVILISVGIWRDNEGKLHGDYDEDEIKDIASFYTPTPGGVGPVNVACLMENLITASTLSSQE
jgi:methylenetetrahydrofolate dehydrogenase (NADP+)/methenyltetrahydrofolate cyclohydrolase